MSAASLHETFFRPARGGVELFVRLTPKSSRDAVEGVGETADGRSHLKARVRAAPEDGKANRALVRLLADRLGISAREVSVVSGATSRLKTIRLAGDPEAISAQLQAAFGKSG